VECCDAKDSHSIMVSGDDSVRIDWAKLTSLLIDEYQGSGRLARTLQLQGIDIDESTFRYYRQNKFGARSTRDVAVWMYLDAKEKGLEIPYFED